MVFIQKDPLTGIIHKYELTHMNEYFELSRNGMLIDKFDKKGNSINLQLDKSKFLLIDDLVANLMSTKIKEGNV